MLILFIGSNPSTASDIDAAFHGSTKSSKILTEWTKGLVGTKVHMNVVNQKTENNRPLKASEIRGSLDSLARDISSIEPTRIVALGKTAAKALTLLHLAFYEMPHPSGRNRLLNDPKYVEEKVKGLVQFCNQTSPEPN